MRKDAPHSRWRPHHSRHSRRSSLIPPLSRTISLDETSSDSPSRSRSPVSLYPVFHYKSSLDGYERFRNYDYLHHAAVWTPLGGMEFVRDEGLLIARKMEPTRWRQLTEDGKERPYLSAHRMGYTNKNRFNKARKHAESISGSKYTASNNCQTAAKEFVKLSVVKHLSSHKLGSQKERTQLLKNKHNRKNVNTALETFKARHGSFPADLARFIVGCGVSLLSELNKPITRFRHRKPKRTLRRHRI